MSAASSSAANDLPETIELGVVPEPVLLGGHFIPGADRHHVEGLADALEEAGRQLAATQPQPDPVSNKGIEP